MPAKKPGELKLGFHLNTPAQPGPEPDWFQTFDRAKQGASGGGSNPPVDWSRAFEDNLQLIEFGEQLGIDSAWSRQRHFQNGYLSQPLTFFAAAAQRTKRIGFGTALLILRYWDPILLGEELSTVDLLTGQRLEVVYSNSRNFRAEFQDEIFRLQPDQVAERIEGTLDRLRSALRGESVYTVPPNPPFFPNGGELYLEPRSPGIIDRLWYGSGSVDSATEAAQKGLDLFVSTVGPGDVEATQVAQVRAYKESLSPEKANARIGVGRYILPVTKPGQEERYRHWEKWFTREFSHGVAPIYIGEPAKIADELAASEVFQQSETLLVYLPFGFSFDEYREQLEALSTEVAPRLGWAPAE